MLRVGIDAMWFTTPWAKRPDGWDRPPVWPAGLGQHGLLRVHVRTGGISTIRARHETAAVSMADASVRASGLLGSAPFLTTRQSPTP